MQLGCRDLTVGYDGKAILKNINFCIETRGKEMMKELSQKETIN